jgi:hypothetical protein
MSHKLSNVSSPYGAPMGRRTYCDNQEAKCSLFKVRLDSGGYDGGGAYFGFGNPLYCCRDDNGQVQLFRRAINRKTVKEIIKKDFPTLKFYR